MAGKSIASRKGGDGTRLMRSRSVRRSRTMRRCGRGMRSDGSKDEAAGGGSQLRRQCSSSRRPASRSRVRPQSCEWQAAQCPPSARLLPAPAACRLLPLPQSPLSSLSVSSRHSLSPLTPPLTLSSSVVQAGNQVGIGVDTVSLSQYCTRPGLFPRRPQPLPVRLISCHRRRRPAKLPPA